MAYDPLLVERVRELLAGRRGVREKPMFGCLGFLNEGRFAFAVLDDSLIVRVGGPGQESALDEPGVQRFAPGGSAMRGWVQVGAEALLTDQALRGWLDRGWRYADGLPAKN